MGALVLAGALIGAFAANLIARNSAAATSNSKVLRETGGYSFISPLLSCNTSDQKGTEATGLESSISSLVEQAVSQGKTSEVSVYYRNMVTGEWADFNPTEHFSLASLGKVPLMMSYLSLEDETPGTLDEKIPDTLASDANLQQEIRPQSSVHQGRTYSIADLLQSMISYSDNNATILLDNHLDFSRLKETYSDLDIPLSEGTGNATSSGEQLTDFITPREYSLFFRVLYNATFISHDMSEYALSLLSKTAFKDGIVAGVTPSTTVSHKFGLTSIQAPDGTIGSRELHDCGIVYHPDGPYLLCVMTKTTSDIASDEQVIADISRMVFQAQK